MCHPKRGLHAPKKAKKAVKKKQQKQAKKVIREVRLKAAEKFFLENEDILH